MYELDVGAKYVDLAGVGYHNDYDMLEVGNGKLTDEEERSHFAIWCLASSPLLAGNNLTAATPATIAILTAPGPISVNQDALALQGRLCGNGTDSAGGVWQVWAKPLADGATAALLLNRNTSAPVKVTIDFSACNVSHPHTDAEITDLWTSKSVDHAHSGSWSATISPHAHRFVKIMPSKILEL